MTQAFRAKQLTGFGEMPAHEQFVEPTPKEIRVVFEGETIARSRGVLILHETKHVPVYYIPMRDVRMEFLEPTTHKSH